MPRGIYPELSCPNAEHPPFTPLPHQEATAEYFLSSPHKGLLLFHQLGSGKTCTAILVADKMLKRKLVKHVYVFSPGSLRSTWIE